VNLKNQIRTEDRFDEAKIIEPSCENVSQHSFTLEQNDNSATSETEILVERHKRVFRTDKKIAVKSVE